MLPFHFGAVLLSLIQGVGRNVYRGVTVGNKAWSFFHVNAGGTAEFSPCVSEGTQGVLHFTIENFNENIFGGKI